MLRQPTGCLRRTNSNAGMCFVRNTIEQEQQGAGRAQYGKEIVRELATRLTSEFESGFSLPMPPSDTKAASSRSCTVW